MVTEVETKERVEAKPITLQELGKIIGIPIKVRPWWGSRRRPYIEALMEVKIADSGEVRHTKVVNEKRHLVWLCPGGDNHTRPKFPEVQNGKIIIWEGSCRLRYVWGRPKIHDHAQTIEVKGVSYKAMLIVIRRSPTAYSQFLIGVDGNTPYAVMVNRHLNTVKEAFDWLTPKLVKEAIARGLDVKRQGDWFFIPTDKDPTQHKYSSNAVTGSALEMNKLYRGVALIYSATRTRHRGGLVVYKSVMGAPGEVPFVKGNVRAPDHETLHLDSWHIGVRNRSHPWRNGQQRARFDD